jgi:hypothetical protein
LGSHCSICGIGYCCTANTRYGLEEDRGINNVSHDDIEYFQYSTLVALHSLGGTCIVWDAYPVGDGSLEIGSLRIEDRTGKAAPGYHRDVVMAEAAARCCEDAAYELANRYSDEPGHYVLALPSGTVISAPSRTYENEDRRTQTPHTTPP